MDQSQLIPAFLTVLISHAPLVVAYLVGIILALGSWNRYRRVAVLALVGCGVLLVHLLAVGTFAAVLPSVLQDRGWTGAEMTKAFHAINLLRSVITTLGIGCLLAAIFARRPA